MFDRRLVITAITNAPQPITTTCQSIAMFRSTENSRFTNVLHESCQFSGVGSISTIHACFAETIDQLDVTANDAGRVTCHAVDTPSRSPPVPDAARSCGNKEIRQGVPCSGTMARRVHVRGQKTTSAPPWRTWNSDG